MVEINQQGKSNSEGTSGVRRVLPQIMTDAFFSTLTNQSNRQGIPSFLALGSAIDAVSGTGMNVFLGRVTFTDYRPPEKNPQADNGKKE